MDDGKLNNTIKVLEKLIADDWIWKHAECCASLCSDALELLKEQAEQKKQILKAVWDVLHEGVSTDTVADQDWVYEQIRNRVDKTY